MAASEGTVRASVNNAAAGVVEPCICPDCDKSISQLGASKAAAIAPGGTAAAARQPQHASPMSHQRGSQSIAGNGVAAPPGPSAAAASLKQAQPPVQAEVASELAAAIAESLRASHGRATTDRTTAKAQAELQSCTDVPTEPTAAAGAKVQSGAQAYTRAPTAARRAKAKLQFGTDVPTTSSAVACIEVQSGTLAPSRAAMIAAATDTELQSCCEASADLTAPTAALTAQAGSQLCVDAAITAESVLLGCRGRAAAPALVAGAAPEPLQKVLPLHKATTAAGQGASKAASPVGQQAVAHTAASSESLTAVEPAGLPAVQLNIVAVREGGRPLPACEVDIFGTTRPTPFPASATDGPSTQAYMAMMLKPASAESLAMTHRSRTQAHPSATDASSPNTDSPGTDAAFDCAGPSKAGSSSDLKLITGEHSHQADCQETQLGDMLQLQYNAARDRTVHGSSNGGGLCTQQPTAAISALIAALRAEGVDLFTQQYTAALMYKGIKTTQASLGLKTSHHSIIDLQACQQPHQHFDFWQIPPRPFHDDSPVGLQSSAKPRRRPLSDRAMLGSEAGPDSGPAWPSYGPCFSDHPLEWPALIGKVSSGPAAAVARNSVAAHHHSAYASVEARCVESGAESLCADATDATS